MTDPKTERLNSIRFRHNAASTDWSLRESGAGRSLYARIIPQEPPALLLTFDSQAAAADENFLALAHEDMRFVLDLLDEAFGVIRKLRVAMQNKPKPKDFAAECAMKCSETAFQRFLHEVHGLDHPWDSHRAATKIHSILNIKSRRELNESPAAAEGWKKLRGEFEAWRKQG